jgi:hypothetical protein
MPKKRESLDYLAKVKSLKANILKLYCRQQVNPNWDAEFR